MTMMLNTPGGVYGALTQTKYTRLYNNPHFDYLSEMLPKNIKQLFQWCELVYNSVPVVTNAVRKLVNYPLTDLVYKTDSDEKRKKTKEFLEETLDIRTHLINLGIDYYIYGNAFRNIYFPFVRMLECRHCHAQTNVIDAKYKLKRGEFILTCGHCQKTGKAKIVDKATSDLAGIKLVTWDPKQIELNQNPITGESAYYYQLPKPLSMGILAGDPIVVNTVPSVFLDAFRQNRVLKFGSNFYHFKSPTIAGYATGWGISPLFPTLKGYMYLAVLRKASEAIGLEHITPQRILFPQANSNDPTLTSSMGRWKEELKNALKNWRLDPNFVMMAPYPTGVCDLGGRGTQLMPTAEIKEAQEDMIRGLDCPVEFIMGTTNLNNTPISLRILENQLMPYVAQLTRYVNWIIKVVNAQYDKDFCQVEFAPFKLADDLMQKSMLVSLLGQGVSRTTVQEALGLKPEEEREKVINEQIEDYKAQKELAREQAQLEQDIASQASDEQLAATTGTVAPLDQQKLVDQASQLAGQLLATPYEQRKGALKQLENQDFVMYALVCKLLEQEHAEGKRQGGVPPAAGGGKSPI